MSYVPLKDILITARQEAHRMRHYYLGVEHLFIALLEITNGLAGTTIAEYGLTPEYVIDAIRRKIGKGSRHRLWAGVPNTPRTEVVLDIAQDAASEEGREHIHERDVLLALLDEEDNIPVRVLSALGIHIAEFRETIFSRPSTSDASQPFVKVDFAPTFDGSLSKEELFVLRRMFYGYGQIRIEQLLTGGYTTARLLVVTPIQPDGREDAGVVVKIGATDAILDEAQRYERYVKSTLPPLTARLEEKPTAPETSDLAAIKYTFITDNSGNPSTLAEAIKSWTPGYTQQWLEDSLYNGFGDRWWKQNRAYRFEAWQEYDWLLPPVLTLEVVQSDNTPAGVHILRYPIKRQRVSALQYGDLVMVENFTVQKVNPERNAIQLALGQGSHLTRAYQVEVRGLDFDQEMYFRGEIVERFVGRVWKTRNEQLLNAARALEPDFDITGANIVYNELRFPNPLEHYNNLLEATIDSTLSTIHGDLHLGNIMIGPQDSPLLIDFGQTREGHTIFDWITLEMSLLNELIQPLASPGWKGAYEIIEGLISLNRGKPPITRNADLTNALTIITTIRAIIARHLHSWLEYYLALSFISLRAMTWQTLDIDNRRLMFLVSALAMNEYEALQVLGGNYSPHTEAPDATDFMSNN
ncbi:MAG: phosphotransferase [Anaerolineae bacterium]|nr:phosphotransferase [Anaerolineae bacterium]